MIIKVGSRSNDPGDLIAYLGGPGNLDEHIDPHVVASGIGLPGPLDKAMQARVVSDLRANAQVWGDKGKHIQHYTLAIGKNEGQLPREKWSDISHDYAEGMGLNEGRWVSVNHGPSSKGNDHVHVVASLTKDDGTRIPTSWDRYRTRDLAVHLEDKHGLEPLPGRRLGTGQRADSQKDLARMRDQGLTESRRSQIERTVRASASIVSTLGGFKDLLEANGLEFHPYPEDSLEPTGYSVSLEATRRADGVLHKWAGGKLARDLSLPRLQLAWKSNASIRPTHIRAVQELQGLQRALPVADALALEDASHQLAGALAAASLVTEETPGDLAQASKQAGAYAQTIRPNLRPKPPALGVAFLFLQSTDPTGPVGKTVMIMQLMAAFRALMDAHAAKRSAVTIRERIPSMAGQAGPEEEMVDIAMTTGITTTALLVEHHARRSEAKASTPKDDLWDAKTIRASRLAEKDAREAQRAAMRPVDSGPITGEQLARADQLGKELDMPSVSLLAQDLTSREAELYLAQMEAKVVHPVEPYVPALSPEDFEAQLEAKHGGSLPEVEEFVEKYGTKDPEASLPYGGPGQRQPAGPAEQLAADLHRPDEKATPLQVLWLTRTAGLSEVEASKMTKASASSYRNAMEQKQGLTPAPKVYKPPPGKGPGIGK